MNRNSLHGVCFLTLLAVSAVRADTQALQPVDDIRSFAGSFLTERLRTSSGATVYATAGTVDSRLRLPRCAGELQGIMPAASQTARLTLGVRCMQPSWTVYVSMTVETELKVLVMRTAADRNGSPTAADVELQQRRVPGFATNYLTDVAQLRGRHLKVPVSPGTALSTDMLAADTLIKRGQRVALIVNVGGIEVSAQGEAVADSTPTGRVRVQNLSSHKIVEGQAESTDRVRMSQ